MSLSVNSYTIAECRIQNTVLRPAIGAYELIFGLMIDIRPIGTSKEEATITGARVTVKSKKKVQSLGFAHTETPIRIEQKDFPYASTPCLQLTISPLQLAALESFRDGDDIDFLLQLQGESHTSNGFYPVQDEISYQMPVSQWIQMLKQAGAGNSLLLEIPLPVGELSEEWRRISNSLHQAQIHFMQGDYRTVVSICREVIEELGYLRYGNDKWNNQSLDRFSNRKEMSKDEREAAIWASIQHYAHQAHHGTSKSGEADYTRSEAQQLFSITAVLVNRYRSREK